MRLVCSAPLPGLDTFGGAGEVQSLVLVFLRQIVLVEIVLFSVFQAPIILVHWNKTQPTLYYRAAYKFNHKNNYLLSKIMLFQTSSPAFNIIKCFFLTINPNEFQSALKIT